MHVNRSSRTKIVASVLIAGLAGLGGIVGVSAAVAQVPSAPRAHAERHPRIDRAITMLERTETDLRKADRDFGGHREKAADLIHQAIEELKLAKQSDKR